MLKKISIGLAVVLALFAGVVASRPSEFVVTRSAVLHAPASKVFGQVNDLSKWEAWSPWAKMDPNAKSSFEGPQAGVGAVMRWDGNRDVGAGSMTITESVPDQRIVMDLEFLKPMKGSNVTEFTFKPEGEHTTVTWTMSGKSNFIAKAFGLFVDCDKMVGGQFEKGLANLGAVVETAAQAKGVRS